MPEITTFEGERKYLDYTLTYGPNWSDATKRGLPVKQSEVTRVYFYVKKLVSDASAWLTLTDASASQIQWLDTTAGKIRVFVGSASTAGHAGDGQSYELRLKLTDGSYCTVDRGTLNVIDSVVDNP